MHKLNLALAVCASVMIADAGTAWAAQRQYGSSAAIALLDLTVTGTNVISPPILATSGLGAPAYHKRQTLAVQGTPIVLPVLPGLAPLTLSIAAPLAQTVADGYAINGGQVALGRSSMPTLSLTLKATTLAGIQQQLLQINGTNVVVNANAHTDAAHVQSTVATAHVRELTITGALVGGQAIVLRGPLKPNTVVFASTLLTITANEIYRSTTSSGQSAISANGLDIAFTNAGVLGSLLNGHVFLDTNTAF